MNKFLALTTAAVLALGALVACDDDPDDNTPLPPPASELATAPSAPDLVTPVPVLTPTTVRTLTPATTLTPVPQTSLSTLPRGHVSSSGRPTVSPSPPDRRGRYDPVR